MALIVDPIRYAWNACNPRVPPPTTLTRAAGSSALAQNLSDAHSRMATNVVASAAAAQAALDLFILSSLPTNPDAIEREQERQSLGPE